MQDAYRSVVTSDQNDLGRSHDVDILLGDLLTVWLQARQAGRAWVGDFIDERIRVSQDLYEVLCAARASAV